MRYATVTRWLHQLHTLAHHDFFPNLSAPVRRFLYHPVGVLTLAALFAAVCGLFLHAQAFILCGGVLAVLALGILWPWLSLRGLDGSITFDRQRLTEGESVTVWLTLRNRLPWSAHGLAVRGGFGGEDNEIVAALASAPRRRSARCCWNFQPCCRGLYPHRTPRLTSGFPFGLWENSCLLQVPMPLIVWPRTYPVGPIPPVSGDRQVEGNVSRNKVGTHGDVLGVRPYRRGDSPRRIHWRQSARHDRLIVCELQSNARPVIQIVLDIDSQVHVGTGADSSREWAIRMAASFARGWLQDGAQVGLAWAGFDLPAASGQAQCHKILDALASVPMTCQTPLAEVLACPRCRGFRDGLQLILTTDRAKPDHGCSACENEEQHWVVLQAKAFDRTCEPSPPWQGPSPWLRIEAIETIPALLRGGWREAQHGS